MIKLGIIGGESSHAWQFASVLNGKNKGKLFDDIELLGVYVNDSSDEGKIGIKNINLIKIKFGVLLPLSSKS